MLTLVRRPHRRPPVLSAVLLGCLLGAGTGIMSGLWAASQDPDELPLLAALQERLPGLLLPAPPAENTTPASQGPSDLTLLVMGTDETAARSSLRGNTDTMLLVHLSPESQQVSVLSIPRDTRVPIPGHRIFKANAANPWGGPELAVDTVSRFLGVNIDRYLLVDLDGISEVVDALGGIDVEIPKRMAYVDRTGGLSIDLAEGRQRLDGEQVEAFLRFRHDGQGDIGRVSRQQALMRDALPQLLHPKQWAKFPKLWAIVREHSRTDLSTRDVVTLARWAGSLDPVTDVHVETVPGRTETVDGLSYWIADDGEAKRLARRLTSPPQITAARTRS